jgi:hypothetical protein
MVRYRIRPLSQNYRVSASLGISRHETLIEGLYEE